MPATLALDMALLPNIAEVAAKMRIDHTGWLQYTSFLKDSGASVRELTEYWGEFYKSVGRTHSDIKKVNYDIRHLFGLEGHRKEFNSFSCKSIISGTDKIHGCPYRSTTASDLTEGLEKLGLSSSEITEITARDTTAHCQLVCGNVFDAVHKSNEKSTSITGPVNYFTQSREMMEENFIKSVNWDEEMVIP